MAAIGKIREKSWLLLIVVGGAMIAFILTMVYGNGGGGQQEDKVGIGMVNGVKINEDQYNTFVKNAENNMMQQKLQQNPNQRPQITQQDLQNAKREAWITVVGDQLMKKEYKQIGLIVDDYELDNVLYGDNGFSPIPQLAAQFKDSVTGKFSPEKLRQAITSLQNSTKQEDVQRYNNVMDFVRQTQLQTKYNTLLTAGIHATDIESQDAYEAKKTVKNVAYVYQSYTKVPKGAVKTPTDEEIKAYFDQHKGDKQYEQTAHRKIAYFAVPIKASKEDSAKMLSELSRMKARFTGTNKDSLFIMQFSDVKHYAKDSTAAARPESVTMSNGLTYPDSLNDKLVNAKIGTVVGPYYSKLGATISKVMGFYTENTATVRHILLKASTPEEYAAAQNRADSIIAVIKAQNNFTEMVKKFSQDPSSVPNGGKYVQFREGMMVKPFNDFSFNQPVGTLGTVKTNYGIHIVEVLGHGPTKRPILASVIKEVKPSRTTIDQYKTKASNYIYTLFDKLANKTPAEQATIFDTFAVDSGYTVQYLTLQDDAPSASGFSGIAEGNILKLAYKDEPKVGTLISSPIHNRVTMRGQVNEQMIVAYLANIVPKGAPTLDLVKNRMKAEVMKNKEAKYIMDQMMGAKDLKALAAKMKAQYKTEGLTFSASNTAVGREPKIIGAAFSGLSDGEMTVPIQGENGAFVLKVIKTTPAVKTKDYSAEQTQIEQQERNSFKGQYNNALRKSADVMDNRALRQFNIR